MRGKGFPLIFWSISSTQKMRGKSFPLIFWVYLLYSKNERKGFSSHFLNSSPLIWQKKTVKFEELEIATFSILGHLFVFLIYFQGCHYCQSDLVVIEFTGHGPHTRKESKSKAYLITGWVGGVKKELNPDYVIYGQSLIQNLLQNRKAFLSQSWIFLKIYCLNKIKIQFLLINFSIIQ